MVREQLLVADAGPLIALATIGRFSFLRELAAEVLVPRGVQAEVPDMRSGMCQRE